MTAFVGFAEFDALATPYSVKVGFAEFDAQAPQGSVYVGWAEFDAAADSGLPAPVFGGGVGGHSRVNWGRLPSFYDSVKKQYNIPTPGVDESEEEEILMQILMEVASHVI